MKVLERGGDDFLRKPFREHEIFEMLAIHLGVEFTYAEDTWIRSPIASEPQPLEQLISMVDRLPADCRKKLAEATELSDAVMIDQVIDEIRIEEAQLADALAGFAENFAYDKILALLQQGWRQPEGAKDRDGSTVQ